VIFKYPEFSKKGPMEMSKIAISVALVLILLMPPAVALEGEKDIVLIGADGDELTIGRVSFKNEGKAKEFSVKLDESKFSDHFLSMRPFKCIDGKKQTLCHLVYPYRTRRQITNEDLTDLEYELMFLRKKPGDYGIDFWNGVYYDLTSDEEGRIRGVLMEADMNVLASPPEQEFARPITDADLTRGDAESHRFPRLQIR